jgi:hypothetical protein
MTEIEDSRGVTYHSWKSYAKALEEEVKCLQQLLDTDDCSACWEAVLLEIRRGRIKAEIWD